MQYSRRIEDIVDDILVGDGTVPSRFFTTTSHPDESEAEAIEFAESWRGENLGKVQIVEL